MLLENLHISSGETPRRGIGGSRHVDILCCDDHAVIPTALRQTADSLPWCSGPPPVCLPHFRPCPMLGTLKLYLNHSVAVSVILFLISRILQVCVLYHNTFSLLRPSRSPLGHSIWKVSQLAVVLLVILPVWLPQNPVPIKEISCYPSHTIVYPH